MDHDRADFVKLMPGLLVPGPKLTDVAAPADKHLGTKHAI